MAEFPHLTQDSNRGGSRGPCTGWEWPQPQQRQGSFPKVFPALTLTALKVCKPDLSKSKTAQNLQHKKQNKSILRATNIKSSVIRNENVLQVFHLLVATSPVGSSLRSRSRSSGWNLSSLIKDNTDKAYFLCGDGCGWRRQLGPSQQSAQGQVCRSQGTRFTFALTDGQAQASGCRSAKKTPNSMRLLLLFF